MPRFRYKSIDSMGWPASGEKEADSADELRTLLEAEGHRVESVEPVKQECIDQPTSVPKELTDEEFESISEPIANVTAAGLPLESGLRALSEEIPSRKMKKTLRVISDRLSRGEPLEKIVAGDIPDTPQPLREVIRAGLATGQPGAVLDAWSEYTRRASEVGRTIWSGLLYSIVLVSILLLVMSFFLGFILPDFKILFDDFGIELPGLTRFVIHVSVFLRNYWIGIVIGLGVIFVALMVISSSKNTRFRHRMIVWIPFIGSARRNLSLSTFCHLLAVLVERRVPMPRALQAAGAGSRDGVIDSACRELALDVERGEDVTTAAGKRKLPPRLSHVFRWSNQPDTFPEALRGSAAVFEGRARAQARLVPRVVEPIVIVGVAFCVGLCVFALFLPLIQLLNELS